MKKLAASIHYICSVFSLTKKITKGKVTFLMHAVHALYTMAAILLFSLMLFLLILLFRSSACAYLSSEYNADKHVPFSDTVYEINPQTGSMGISAEDLALKGRAGHDLIIGRVYSNTLANAYNMGVRSGIPIKAATTHLDQKYGLGCGWGFSFPSLEINFDMQEIMGRPQYNLYFGNGGVYTLDFNSKNGISYYELEDMKVSDQDAGYYRSDQGYTITSRYSLTMKDQSKYYFDRWGNLLARYDSSHRQANKIEFFYQGGVTNDLGGHTYHQNARIAYILDNCGRRVNFTYRNNNTLEKITWTGDDMEMDAGDSMEGDLERTIVYYQEAFDTYEGSQKYVLSQVVDAAGRSTRYKYIKHEVRFSFGGLRNSRISDTMTNYYADLTDVYYNCQGENYTSRLLFEYSNPEEYIKLFGQDHPGSGEKEGFLWYYKVKSRWEEDLSRRICRKVSLSYQGEAYRAITPEVFEGTGVIGYQTTVNHCLTEGGLDTWIRQEKYGYHVDKHFLLRRHQVRAEGIEDLTEYTYNDKKCPAKNEVFRKKTISGDYQKISDHIYSYNKYKDLIEEINEENVRTLYLYHSTYHHLIRKEIQNNCNAENVLNTHLWTWVIDPSFGDTLEQRQHRRGDSSTYITNWKKSYDQTLGTVIREEDALGHVTTYEYDSIYHAYPTKIIIHKTNNTDQEDPDDIIEQYTYYPHGLKKTYTNATGYTTSYTYDQVDRLLKETYSDNSFQERIYDDFACTGEVIDEEGQKLKEYFDGLGHLVKQERYLIDKATVYSQKSYTYDSLGRKTSSEDSRGNTTCYEYDALARLTRTTYPDFNYKTIVYDDLALKKIIYDANRHQPKVTYNYDRLGRTVKIYEQAMEETLVTAYSYDFLNQRIMAEDAKHQITKFVYDDLNRLVKIIYPDTKFETREYDQAGNLKKQTDRRNNTITLDYDFANRLIRKTYPDGTQVSYTYYKNGQIKQEKDQASTTNYDYNHRDWLTKKTQTIAGLTYTTEYQYNKVGSCTSVKYPLSTEWLLYAYDDLQRVETIYKNDTTHQDDTIHQDSTTYAYFEYYPTDHLYQINFGHGLTTTFTLDQRNRPTDINTSHNILSLHYEYDHENNILKENENTYTYDYLDRLISANLSDPLLLTGNQQLNLVREHFGYDSRIHHEKYLTEADLNHDQIIDGVDLALAAARYQGAGLAIGYTYDALGNREIKAEGDLTTTYQYSFNRLMSAENIGGRIEYVYDNNGNLTQKKITDLATSQVTVWDYAFDYDNRLTQVKKDGQLIAAYTYDPRGNRIKKTLSGSSQTTIYHYDQWGNVIVETDAAGKVTAEYILSGEQHIAKVENGKITYYHNDLIKSARVLTNEQGEKVWWRDYKPFGSEYKGEELSGESGDETGDESGDETEGKTNYTFTGQEEDEESGLFYYGARYYDAEGGRFVSEDPAEGDWDDPQSSNRYVYCRNNPLKYVDPTGESFGDFFKCLGNWASGKGWAEESKVPDEYATGLVDFWLHDSIPVGPYRENGQWKWGDPLGYAEKQGGWGWYLTKGGYEMAKFGATGALGGIAVEKFMVKSMISHGAIKGIISAGFTAMEGASNGKIAGAGIGAAFAGALFGPASSEGGVGLGGKVLLSVYSKTFSYTFGFVGGELQKGFDDSAQDYKTDNSKM